ncbi:MAG TPA: PQQ-dependent sugar dehydrogenase [Verrucomicrobiae bacterium]|jgi:glucose/arabinose dehydrogenase
MPTRRVQILLLTALPLLSAGFAGAQPVGLSSRLANSTLAMPQQPAVYGYQFVNAFGANTFTSPLCIRTPPGETNRVFVLQRGGSIQVVTNIGAPSPTKSQYMSLAPGLATTGEQGLLGLEFHPNFQSNGYFFIYRAIMVTNPSTLVVVTNERLSRFQASPPSAATANTNTEVILFEQLDPANNHNGGDLHFGPDGYLYVSVGDGGNQNDLFNNTQTIRKGFHSGILRLDVDVPQRPASLAPSPPSSISGLTNLGDYAVPPDNPWVTNVFIYETNRSATLSTNVRTEFWAVGLRNPWRFSFDPMTGWLWEGDVGGNLREEVNIITKGGDYGWAYREGFVAATQSKNTQTNAWYNTGTPAPWATNFAGIDPIFDYTHGTPDTNTGLSVTGGIVYRGNNLSQLTGAYVFADYGVSTQPGNVWSFRYNGTNVSQFQLLLQDPGLVAFGTDPRNGDLLAADISEGIVKRLVYNTNVFTGTPLPPTLADTGAFSDLAALTPNAGIVPYAGNVPSWSDNALKSHWFSVPNTNLTIGWSATSNWSFPTGTVWIQHFELVTNHLTQAKTRLETRLLVRHGGGAYGATYRWGGNPTNATLVSDGGTNDTFVITDPGGLLRTQLWYYPSRNDCLACHMSAGGFAPGFNTPQLNCMQTYSGFPGATGATDNQLHTLSAVGYFNPPASNLNTLLALAHATNAATSLEWRVRSYLAVNCAQCHQQPVSPARGLWEARITTPTALAGIINGPLLDDFGNTNARVIAPGSLANAMIYTRITSLTSNRMPPLGSSLLDTNDINLVAAWINSAALAGYQTFAQWQVANFGSTNATNGSADADRDGDGVSNFLEYLLGSNPTEPSSDWRVSIQMNGPNPQIVFPQIANRGFEVQCRASLIGPPLWVPLNVPGSAPFFSAVTFTNVVEDTTGSGTNKTYRVRVFAP